MTIEHDIRDHGQRVQQAMAALSSPDGPKVERANDRQVDGGHYVKYGDLQPWDMWVPWNLNGFQCEVLKLVVRYRDKNGTKDLQKAIHYLEKLIEIEKAKS